MLKVKSLRVDYENVVAACDIDINIQEGQIYGLVGPNGAGKTSILNAIIGFVESTYGEVKICGYDTALNPQEAFQQVGFMPDFNPVCENLKVGEYLEVFAMAYLIERNKRGEIIEKWLERVNLKEKRDAYIHTLSRGMRQRLVFARTLLHDPKVILLDEPASGLDPIGRIEIRNILKEMAVKKKAIIISSHILTELNDLCDMVGIMEKGKMVVSGTMDEIRSIIGLKKEIIIHLSDANRETKQKLLNALKTFPNISDIKEEKEGVFRADFSGDKSELPRLLNKLTKENLPIVQFFAKKGDIEDVFLKVGAKKLS